MAKVKDFVHTTDTNTWAMALAPKVYMSQFAKKVNWFHVCAWANMLNDPSKYLCCGVL